MRLKLFFVLVVFCLPHLLVAGITDTVRVEEVDVIACQRQFFTEDFKTFTVDTLSQKLFVNENLQDVLQYIAPIQLVTYGSAGSLSSVRLRGGSGNHTQINWNGFPINSLTSGSADVSLLSFNKGDKVSIIYGASGALYGSGAVDGVIDIDQQSFSKDESNISGSYEFGSFSHNKGVLGVRLGGEKLSFSLNANCIDAKNNFSYHIARGDKRNNDHNSLNSLALVPYLDFKTQKYGQFGLGAWYQVRDKDIPVTMNSLLSAESYQHQTDRVIRLMAKWKKLGDKYSFEYKTAYFNETLIYTDKNFLSNIHNERWYENINLRMFLTTNLSFDVGGQFALLWAKVSNYEKTTTVENDGSLFSAVKFRTVKYTLNASSRLVYNSSYGSFPVFALGGKYKFRDEKLIGRFSISSKYRQPTFNDRYWEPYGNPDLNPEKGYVVESGLRGYFNLGMNSIECDFNTYYSDVKDWIEWAPKNEGESAGMAPKNNKKVRSLGFEFSGCNKLVLGKTFLKFNVNYSFNHTVNNDPKSIFYGHYLTYTPLQKVGYGLIGEHKQFLLSWNGNYTGWRYASEENSSSGIMDAYLIHNAQLKYQMKYNHHQLNAFFKVANVFNVDYQVIEYYQMPGRAFYVGVEISFNQLNNMK